MSWELFEAETAKANGNDAKGHVGRRKIEYRNSMFDFSRFLFWYFRSVPAFGWQPVRPSATASEMLVNDKSSINSNVNVKSRWVYFSASQRQRRRWNGRRWYWNEPTESTKINTNIAYRVSTPRLFREKQIFPNQANNFSSSKRYRIIFIRFAGVELSPGCIPGSKGKQWDYCSSSTGPATFREKYSTTFKNLTNPSPSRAGNAVSWEDKIYCTS